MPATTRISLALAAALATGAAGLAYAGAVGDCPEGCEKACCVPVSADADKTAVPEKYTYLGVEGLPENMKEGIRNELMPMVGKPAPELSLTDFRNVEDGSFTNESFKGKITIVDIWATWCGPCIAAIPKNNKLYEDYKDQGVVVLGVTTSSGQENLDKLLEEHPISYPLAKDPDTKTLEAWKASFFPTYYVVDRDGIVRGVALTPDSLEDVVKMLLEEDAATATADAR